MLNESSQRFVWWSLFAGVGLGAEFLLLLFERHVPFIGTCIIAAIIMGGVSAGISTARDRLSHTMESLCSVAVLLCAGVATLGPIQTRPHPEVLPVVAAFACALGFFMISARDSVGRTARPAEMYLLFFLLHFAYLSVFGLAVYQGPTLLGWLLAAASIIGPLAATYPSWTEWREKFKEAWDDPPLA